jgi:hypothetical protein
LGILGILGLGILRNFLHWFFGTGEDAKVHADFSSAGHRDINPNGCECVGLPETLLGDEAARQGYPKTYGGECAAHDLTTEACTGPSKPAYCYELWCYVDPSCNEADKKETFFFKGAPMQLYYSYGHCDGLDIYAAEACGRQDVSTCTDFSNNCVFNEHTKACENKLCQCTGDNVDMNTKAPGILGFSKDYGTSCSNWDQDSCGSWKEKGDGLKLGLWCCKDWCYVDPSCPSATKSLLKDGLYFSYYACPDDHSNILHCPWTEPMEFGIKQVRDMMIPAVVAILVWTLVITYFGYYYFFRKISDGKKQL